MIHMAKNENEIRQRFGLGPTPSAEAERAQWAGTSVGTEADRLYALGQRFRLSMTWRECLAAAQQAEKVTDGRS
jgi:hypothetical protein